MERLVLAFNDLFIVSDRKGLQRAALKIRKKRSNKKITFKDFILAVVLPQNKVGNVLLHKQYIYGVALSQDFIP